MTMQYGCSKRKRTSYYKPCNGAVLEINASGYVNYIEMECLWARTVYAGPITDWDAPGGVWTGCCVGCWFCKNGCVSFDVLVIPNKAAPENIRVNGILLSKSGQQKGEVPVVVATVPIDHEYATHNQNPAFLPQ